MVSNNSLIDVRGNQHYITRKNRFSKATVPKRVGITKIAVLTETDYLNALVRVYLGDIRRRKHVQNREYQSWGGDDSLPS